MLLWQTHQEIHTFLFLKPKRDTVSLFLKEHMSDGRTHSSAEEQMLAIELCFRTGKDGNVCETEEEGGGSVEC